MICSVKFEKGKRVIRRITCKNDFGNFALYFIFWTHFSILLYEKQESILKYYNLMKYWIENPLISPEKYSPKVSPYILFAYNSFDFILYENLKSLKWSVYVFYEFCKFWIGKTC